MQHSSKDPLDGDRSRNSSGNMTRNSESSSKSHSGTKKGKKEKRSPASIRTRTRRRHASDGDGNSGSYYSEDYENSSASGRSLSASSRSLSPVPQSLGHTKGVSSSPLHKPGLRKSGSRHLPPGVPPQRGGVRSQSLNKEHLPKDLDLVTKRMLSARLLKINELKNELSETQLRLQQLQQENRVLRQLQLRQEKALQRFEDTESEIGQLLSRHSGEVHALRDRLRRAQEKERAADRRQREVQEELNRCRAALQKLRRLAEERHLGEREELARKLEQAEGRLAESERRVKDLERSLDLTSSSLQRQLTAERRKTHEVQEEVKVLKEDLERLGQKLKEKERELDTRNIYANRMKPANRREAESSTKKKGLPTRTSKGVQTEERTLALELPAPPPAILDVSLHAQRDNYLSLKVASEGDRSLRAEENWIKGEKEEELRQEQEMDKARRLQGDEPPSPDSVVSPLTEAADTGKRHTRPVKEDERRGQNTPQVQEKKERSQEALDSLRELEERSRKDQLLAKMREIDQQGHDTHTDLFLSGISEHKTVQTPPRTTFSLTDLGQSLRDGDPMRKAEPLGRRGLWTLGSNEDLSFGSYAPSFGRLAPRAGLVGLAGPKSDDTGVAFASGKEWKPSLMEQLFGPSASAKTTSRMEVLSFPSVGRAPAAEGSAGKLSSTDINRKRGDLFSASGGRLASYDKAAVHVAESRPTVRALASFDDDIEEVTL